VQCIEDFYHTIVEVLKQGQEISDIGLKRKLYLMKELLFTGMTNQTEEFI
jgi:hypothetical protein